MDIENALLVSDFKVAPADYIQMESGDTGAVIALVVNELVEGEDGERHPIRLGFTEQAAIHLAWSLLGAILMPTFEDEAGDADT